MPPLENYEPPAGIERRGGLQARGAKLRRRYDHDKKWVTDARCGEASWASGDVLAAIAAWSQQAFERHLEEALR